MQSDKQSDGFVGTFSACPNDVHNAKNGNQDSINRLT